MPRRAAFVISTEAFLPCSATAFGRAVSRSNEKEFFSLRFNLDPFLEKSSGKRSMFCRIIFRRKEGDGGKAQ